MVRYGFAATSAELGWVPLAAGAEFDESAGVPGALAGAPGEPLVTTILPTLLGGVALIPPDDCVTYCGVRPFHHEARPENHPSAMGGCPFPSYAGEDMRYPVTMPGRLNSSLSTDPSVRIC